MPKAPNIQPNLVQVAWALNLYRLGNDVAGVFIPLVILKSGGKLWMIGLFYLLYACIKLCINYPLMRIIQNKGAHFGLGAGFTFSILEISSILGYSHSHSLVFLILASVSLAFTNGFVWNAQHFFISRNMNSATKSSNIASIEIYGRIFDIIGPIIGGFVGAEFGVGWLLVAAIIIIATTIRPLTKMTSLSLATESVHIRYGLHGAPKRDLIANFCFNIESAIGNMIWPVYLAVVIASFKSIGGISAVAAAAAMIATWVAGHRGDKGKDRSVLRQGVMASSIVDVLRTIAIAPAAITAISAAYQSSLAYLINPWTSTYYQHAQDEGPQYIISMEIACDLAYVTLWGLFFILVTTISDTRIIFNIIFLVAAGAAWGCLLITRQIKNN
jgi:hypothetical protein